MYNGAKPYGTCSYDHHVTNDHIHSAKVVSILTFKAHFNTATSLLKILGHVEKQTMQTVQTECYFFYLYLVNNDDISICKICTLRAEALRSS